MESIASEAFLVLSLFEVEATPADHIAVWPSSSMISFAVGVFPLQILETVATNLYAPTQPHTRCLLHLLRTFSACVFVVETLMSYPTF